MAAGYLIFGPWLLWLQRLRAAWRSYRTTDMNDAEFQLLRLMGVALLPACVILAILQVWHLGGDVSALVVASLVNLGFAQASVRWLE